MKLETDLEDKVCAYALNALGLTNIKVKAAGQRGYPDRQFFIPGGRPIFIEFKRPAPEGQLSKGQKVIIRRLRYYGYDVEVCDSFEESIKVLKRALESARIPKESA